MRDKYCVIYEVLRTVKCIETEVERQLPGAEGREKWGDPVGEDEARWW